MNLFKFKKKEKLAIDVFREKSVNDLIDEIHETFYTEVDKLLEEANIKTPESLVDKAIFEKGEKLKSLGFVNTKEVAYKESISSKVSDINYENQKKEGLKKAIKYFSEKYPQYKFITEDSIKKICDKYGLIYGDVSHYIGNVPDENLQHIINFKVEENDLVYEHRSKNYEYRIEEFGKLITTKDFLRIIAKETHHNKYNIRVSSLIGLSRDYKPATLLIAAPKKDFNLQDRVVFNNKITTPVKDPVVFHPVSFEDDIYYLIVTAWGKESSDELIMNPKYN